MAPSRSSYQQHLLRADVLLKVPELVGATWTLDAIGMPKTWSGAYAVVFKASDGQHRNWAMRCPTQELQGSEQQYRVVSQYLASTPLGYTVQFKYFPRGFMVEGALQSVTISEWINGLSLKAFAGQNLGALPQLRQAWDQVAKDMVQRGIAHGDLQHENILVDGNARNPVVRLVDYDSFVVPTNYNQVEVIGGVPGYQHPRRASTVLHKHPRVDAFSLLILDLSLRALEYDPSLWNTLDLGSADSFILSEEDLQKPHGSAILSHLCTLGGAVALLAREIQRALAQPDPLACRYPWEVVGQGPVTTGAGQAMALPGWMHPPTPRSPHSPPAVHAPALPASVATGGGPPPALWFATPAPSPEPTRPAQQPAAVAMSSRSTQQPSHRRSSAPRDVAKRLTKVAALIAYFVVCAVGVAIGAVLLLGILGVILSLFL